MVLSLQASVSAFAYLYFDSFFLYPHPDAVKASSPSDKLPCALARPSLRPRITVARAHIHGYMPTEALSRRMIFTAPCVSAFSPWRRRTTSAFDVSSS